MAENNSNENSSTSPNPNADAPLISMGADLNPIPPPAPQDGAEGNAAQPPAPSAGAPPISTEESSSDAEPTAETRVDEAVKVPTVVPRGGDTGSGPVEEPLSSDTIAIKRPVPRKKADKQPEPQAAQKEEKKSKRLKIFCHNCAQKLDLTDIEPFSAIECPSCSAPIIVPRWFDNYLLEELCGKGGMATVYRALDLALDREVAIKILNQDIADNETRNKLFLHEARTAATLNHYALLPIYTCGEFEGQAYIVMQFMAGGSLEQEIEASRHSPLPIGEIRKWLKDAAEGLDNARRHGIIHHDIKPGNLMLDDDRNVKIGDFGLSQALYDTNSQDVVDLTKAWGSPHYVSPEKVTEKKESYLGDIYSLGATFYHVITGHTPFDSDDNKELLKIKTLRDPLHIGKLRADIPKDFADLIMDMMNRTPEARPSYRDIVAEINAMAQLGGGPKPARKKTAASAPPARRSRPKPQLTAPRNNQATRSRLNMDPQQIRFSSGAGRGYVQKQKSGGLFLPIIVLILVGLAAGFFFLNPLGGSGSTYGDALPDISDYLAQGNSKMAAILAEEAFNAGAEPDIKRQAAAQMAISLLLNNDKSARSRCGSIVADMMASEKTAKSPEMKIVEYFASKTHEPQKLRSNIGNDNGARMQAEIAIFVQSVYDDGSKKEQRIAYKNFMALASVVPDTYWVCRSWKTRMPLWRNWLSEGRGNPKKMERLIALRPPGTPSASPTRNVASSSRPTHRAAVVAGRLFGKLPSHVTPKSSLNLEDLTAAWLEAHRAFATNRPRPDDFSFSQSAVRSYLSSLSRDKQGMEQTRLEQIMPLKEHFSAMTLHVPYEGGKLVTKSGKVVSGTMMANRKYISAKPRGGARVRVYWNDMPPGEFAKMLAYYAELRSKMGDAGTGPSGNQRTRDAGLEMLRAAILCDWYGDYENAVKYAKKTVELDSRLKNTVIVTMME